jgi:hypothetical protein
LKEKRFPRWRVLAVAALTLALATPVAMAAWRNGSYVGKGKSNADVSVSKVSFKVRKHKIRKLAIKFKARCQYVPPEQEEFPQDKPDVKDRGTIRSLVAVKIKPGGSFEAQPFDEDVKVALRGDKQAYQPSIVIKGRIKGRKAKGRLSVDYGRFTDDSLEEPDYQCGNPNDPVRFSARRR